MTAGDITGARSARTPTLNVSAYQVTKRVLDVLIAALLLVVTLPITLAVAASVKLSSTGPVLFRQARIGRDGAVFIMLKFRSMLVDADDTEHRRYVTQLLTKLDPPNGGRTGIYKIANDPRVTRLGRWLRQTSIDELPQLLNVLGGDMSLVGPRPALAWEVALYEPRHRVRLLVKPGLTGLWQVSGRSTLTMRAALDLDVEYAQRQSLPRDLAILARTPWALVRGGAR